MKKSRYDGLVGSEGNINNIRAVKRFERVWQVEEIYETRVDVINYPERHTVKIKLICELI